MSGETVRNVSNPEEIQKAEKREKRNRIQELEDLRWILNDPRGRRFIWRLLAICGVNRVGMTGDKWTFFHLGERNVGVKLTAEVAEASPEAYIEMIKESLKEEQKT